MQGKNCDGMIKNQLTFYNNKVINELILFTLCCTVELIERDIDGKKFIIIETTIMYIWLPCNSSTGLKVLKSHYCIILIGAIKMSLKHNTP